MQDRELYQTILVLVALWCVAGVRLDVEPEEIVVDVEHSPQTRFGSPECGLELNCHDPFQSRDWRHFPVASSGSTQVPVGEQSWTSGPSFASSLVDKLNSLLKPAGQICRIP